MSAENLLLTFTNINKDIFPEATRLVLDMSTALGQDLKSSAIELGKALQDPILGVTALRRVGVNFNEAQTEVIKKLTETGHAAEAQQLIMKELNTEFGGSAQAQLSTYGGRVENLKNKFEEVKEKLGIELMPVLDKLFVEFDKNLPAIERMVVGLGDAIGIVANGLVNTVGIAVKLHDAYTNVFEQAGKDARDLFNQVTGKKAPAPAAAPQQARPTDYLQIPSFLAGARAEGGPVMAGESYLVGEHGPEVFRPTNTGTITPSQRGGMTVHINFYGTVAGDQGVRDIIHKAINEFNRQSTLIGVAGV